jgi:formate hydrogenlyase subunit 4
MDKLFNIFAVTMAVVLIGVLAYAIPKDIERTDRAQEIAKAMGCEYVGSARDLNSIKFLDCNGEIKMIRVKLK